MAARTAAIGPTRAGRVDVGAAAWMAPAAVLALTLAACWARAAWLPSVQGTMGRDEARLALAARGILQHGVPVLPDGLLYTRGLLPAYLEALSFALLGVTDQAARLPSLVFGTLLVPATYLLGRVASGARGGAGPALAAAAVVAFAQPLVLQAREAWLYSSLLLWSALALAWLGRDGPGDRRRAGLALLAAMLSHELGVLLVGVAFVLDATRLAWARRGGRARGAATSGDRPGDGPAALGARGEGGSGAGAAATRGAAGARGRMLSGFRGPARAEVVGFWALALGGVLLVGGLSLLLRAPTGGGATVELREYLRPSLGPAGIDATLGVLGGWHAWLLPAAALALPLSRAGLRRLAARPALLAAPLAVLAVILFNAFGLVQRGESRYVLPALPPLAVWAAVGVARVGPTGVATLLGVPLARTSRRVLGAILLTLLVVLGLDPARLLADARARDVPGTWVQAVADRAPDDLVVSFAPTLTTHYLGRTDAWLRADGYEKYVWADRRPLRDVHTGAVVVRDLRDLEALLLRPHAGRTAWVILAGEPARESPRALREVATALEARAVEVRRPPDGRVVLRVPL